MNHLTNLVQFPGLGLGFHLNRVAFYHRRGQHLLVRRVHRSGPLSGTGLCLPAAAWSSV